MLLSCSIITIQGQKLKIGTYTFKDGAVYTGDLEGGRPNGKGKTVFKNGDVYEGQYVKGKRQGKGIYTFPDGEKYDGLGVSMRTGKRRIEIEKRTNFLYRRIRKK